MGRLFQVGDKMVGEEATGFLGVNLRKDRLTLADEDLAKAINADLHTQPGSILLRLGRSKLFTTALGDLVVRRLARINSRRYQVAGQTLYRDQVSILTGLHRNLVTTLVPFRPLNDTTLWTFIADDAVMRKDNGTSVRVWGLAVPTTPSVAIGIDAALTGAYSARITHVRLDGTAVAHEGNPSTVSETLALSSTSLAIGDILHPTDAQVGGFGIYRTVADGVTHQLDSRVTIPTQNAYTVCHTWEVSAVAPGLQLHLGQAKTDLVAAGGTRFPETGAQDASFGTGTWSNYSFITSSDNREATASRSGSPVTMRYLVASKFGFAIPTTATILGIGVEIERRASGGTGTIVDSRLRIMKAGVIGTTDRASSDAWPKVTDGAVKPYGSNTDLWGETWTPADINATNFGVALSVLLTPSPTTQTVTARVDAIRVTIYGSAGVSRVTQAWEVMSTFVGTSEDAAGRTATGRWEITDGYVTTQSLRWAYNSVIADDSLGAAVELDNNTPPLASWVTEYQGHMMLCRDATNPHYLWFSKRFRPESVPTENFIEIGNPDDAIQCAVQISGLLGIFTRRTKYRVLGSTSTSFAAQEAISRRGTPAPQAVKPTERGIIFPARDGVFLTNLAAPDEEMSNTIEPIFNGEAVNGIEAINWDAAATMAAETFKGRYYLSLPTGTASTTPNLLAVYSADTARWYFFDHPCRSLLTEEDTDQLTTGFTDGFVYVLDDGSDEAGTAIALDVETKDYTGGVLDVRKLFQWVRVDADMLGETLTVEMYVDDVLKRTATVTGTRTRALLPFPSGALGYSWRARLRYTGRKRIRIHSVAAIWLPLEAA